MNSITSPLTGHQSPTLTHAQREALAEWDATPPWYRPRWQVTPQGKALGFDPAQAFQDEIEAYKRWQATLAERYDAPRKVGGVA